MRQKKLTCLTRELSISLIALLLKYTAIIGIEGEIFNRFGFINHKTSFSVNVFLRLPFKKSIVLFLIRSYFKFSFGGLGIHPSDGDL